MDADAQAQDYSVKRGAPGILVFTYVCFCIASFLDLVSSWRLMPAETNPWYLLFGGGVVLIAVKLASAAMLWFVLFKTRWKVRWAEYGLLYVVVGSLVLMVVAFVQNVGLQAAVAQDPEILVRAAQVSEVEKLSSYWVNVLLPLLALPALAIFAFVVWDRSHFFLCRD